MLLDTGVKYALAYTKPNNKKPKQQLKKKKIGKKLKKKKSQPKTVLKEAF